MLYFWILLVDGQYFVQIANISKRDPYMSSGYVKWSPEMFISIRAKQPVIQLLDQLTEHTNFGSGKSCSVLLCYHSIFLYQIYILVMQNGLFNVVI